MLMTSRCQCGAEFCYVCGKSWQGIHGCPHYGPAIYDEEGYNQDGFHRDTGLDREGQTRLRDDSDGDEDEDEDDDPDAHHFVLQHVDAAMRATFNALPHQDREAFLLNLQIQLFEERGVTFDLPDEHGRDDESSDDEEEDEDENEDIDNLDEDGYLGDNHDRTKDDDRDSDNDSDNNADTNNADTNDADPNTTGQNDSARDIGQNNAPLAADIATPGSVNEALTRPGGALVGTIGMEESFDATAQVLGAFRNDASSSATSPDTDRPATPMEVDSAEQGTKQKHEPWTGTLESTSDDEEL